MGERDDKNGRVGLMSWRGQQEEWEGLADELAGGTRRMGGFGG